MARGDKDEVCRILKELGFESKDKNYHRCFEHHNGIYKESVVFHGERCNVMRCTGHDCVASYFTSNEYGGTWYFEIFYDLLEFVEGIKKRSSTTM